MGRLNGDSGAAGILAGNRLTPRKPLGREVYETLKKAILNGELEPGQRLIEEQLAETFGASRTPIRQAFHMLEREDLVERPDRGGFVVKALSVEDIAEIMDLRLVLESFAARKAAENIRSEAIEVLTKLNEAFGQAMGSADRRRQVELNTEFHDALYNLAGNRRLLRMIDSLRSHFYRYRVALLRLEDMARTSYEDHREMISAMSAGDPDLTEQLVRSHLQKGKNLVLGEFQASKADTGKK